MAKIRLTENFIHKIIRESINRLIFEDETEINQLRERVKELSSENDRLTRQIAMAMKKMPSVHPEDWEKRQQVVDELKKKREEVRQEKIRVNKQIKSLLGKPAASPNPDSDISKKRQWSEIDAGKIEANKAAEQKYQQLLSDGYLIYPKAKKAIRLSNGKMKFEWLTKAFDWLSKHIEMNYPGKKLKPILIQRKKERGQLDDEIYFDVKAVLVDAEPTSTNNGNRIRFSPDDLPYKQGDYMP